VSVTNVGRTPRPRVNIQIPLSASYRSKFIRRWRDDVGTTHETIQSRPILGVIERSFIFARGDQRGRG
jgi:hypothetical protein